MRPALITDLLYREEIIIVSRAPAAPQNSASKQPTSAQPQPLLGKRAVDLFTFLRELVSLRTTVVRNCENYDRVLWLDQVPREPECECVAFRPIKDEEDQEDWWLRVRKPNFVEPPALSSELIRWIDIAQLRDSSLAMPRPLDQIEVPAETVDA